MVVCSMAGNNRILRTAVALCVIGALESAAGRAPKNPVSHFQTSDRCLACHNGITSPSGEDVSIGFDWRPTMMANSSRDPYWQAGVRREVTEHPESSAHIEDECSKFYMPMSRYQAKLNGR